MSSKFSIPWQAPWEILQPTLQRSKSFHTHNYMDNWQRPQTSHCQYGSILDAFHFAMQPGLPTRAFKRGADAYVWMNIREPRPLLTSVTWLALGMEITHVEVTGQWMSIRTLPTTHPTWHTLDASQTALMTWTDCSLRGNSTTSGTTHQSGE